MLKKSSLNITGGGLGLRSKRTNQTIPHNRLYLENLPKHYLVASVPKTEGNVTSNSTSYLQGRYLGTHDPDVQHPLQKMGLPACPSTGCPCLFGGSQAKCHEVPQNTSVWPRNIPCALLKNSTGWIVLVWLELIKKLHKWRKLMYSSNRSRQCVLKWRRLQPI
jgi:hypothetical protein